MKLLYVLLMSGLVLATFANCSKKNNNGASADMSAQCFFQQRASNGSYYGGQQYAYNGCGASYRAAGSGFSEYNGAATAYQSGGAVNVGAGCYYNQTPTYSQNRGMGCVDNRNLNMSGMPAYYTLNMATGYFSPAGANPYMYNQYDPYGYQNNSSTNLVLRTCDGGEGCPSGQACRSPFGYAGPALGVCYIN